MSFGLAKQLDNYNISRKEAGLSIPQDSFSKHLFRQPTLVEPPQYPERYRVHGEYGFFSDDHNRDPDEDLDTMFPMSADTDKVAWANAIAQMSHSPSRQRTVSLALTQSRMRSRSINPHALLDESADDQATLEEYFHEEVLRYAHLTAAHGSYVLNPMITGGAASGISASELETGVQIADTINTAGDGSGSSAALTSPPKDISSSTTGIASAGSNVSVLTAPVISPLHVVDGTTLV